MMRRERVHPALLALLAAALGACDGAAIVSRDGGLAVTSRALRGGIGSRLAAAAVARLHAVDAKTGRTVASTTPNAQGQFSFPALPKGVTYRLTAQAGRRAVPVVFPKQMGAPARTNLFNIGRRGTSRTGTLDGPIDLGALEAVMVDGEVQLTPMNPQQAPNLQEDFDEDGMTDGVDLDDDGDGIPDDMDPDDNADGVPDNDQFADQDGDGITNESDADVDGDGVANGADPDNDNDGTPDAMDSTPNGVYRGTSDDTDGDGVPNAEDSTDPDEGLFVEGDGGVPGDGGTSGDVVLSEDGGATHSDIGVVEEDAAAPPEDAAPACVDEPQTSYHPTGPHWTYMEQAEWGAITEDGGTPFSMCTGMQQTPVNIVVDGLAAETRPLTFHNYGTVPLRIVNNGHTVQVNVAGPYGESSPHVMFAGTRYYLAQLHGHAQSEHQINGAHASMEWHFVHSTTGRTDGSGEILVVGVLFDAAKTSPSNGALQPLLTNGPAMAHEQTLCSVGVNLGALIPANRSFFHYSPGSLTTPPCTMGLQWFVMRDQLTLSQGQMGSFVTAFGGQFNNRAVQPLNMRMVTQYTAP